MRKKLSKVMALICVATITVTSMPYLSDSTKGAIMDFSAENSSVMVDKGGYKKEVYGVGTDDWGVTWTDRKNNLPTRTTYLTDNYKETVGTVPTNDWASSVVFDKYSESLYAHPLAYRAASNGMQMASPAVTSGTSYVDGEPTVESLLEDNTVELVIGGNNFSAKDAKVDKTTDWTYDILMENNASTSSIMATIGKGTPYAYYNFKNVEPTISLGAGGTDLAIYKNSTSSNILGVSLKNKKDGKTHYYLISAPSGTTWVNAGGKLTAKMPAGKNYMSVAILPDGSDNAFELYKKYAFNFITDTKVEWKYLSNSSKVVTKYNVSTKNMETGANGGDTIIALYPHQWRYTNSKFTGYTYETIRGTMKTVVGTNYSTTMQYNGILSSLPVTKDEETVGKIKDQLGYLYSYRKSKDNPKWICFLEGQYGGYDTYWVGKNLNTLSDAIWLADQFKDNDMKTMTNDMVEGVENYLKFWFDPYRAYIDGQHVDDYFYYDKEYGTLIGYPTSYDSDKQVNDHHFHYGYWIKAAAAVAMKDPQWAKEWGGMVYEMIGDIANANRDGSSYNRNSETKYPFLRNFDIYEGHSWASGVANYEFDENGEMVDKKGGLSGGNNQESSSESVNAWSSLILWGEAVGDERIRDLGIYMYTTEIAAIEDYYYDVHDEIFTKEYKDSNNYNIQTVTRLFGGRYDHTAWWTENPIEVTTITMLPISGATLYMGKYKDKVKAVVDSIGENSKQWSNFVNNKEQICTNYGKKDMLTDPKTNQDVVAEYYAYYDPDAALAKVDLSDSGKVENGESRAHTLAYITSLKEYGNQNFDITGSTPFSVVLEKNGVKTYVVENHTDKTQRTYFSDKTYVDVPANSVYAGGKSGDGENPNKDDSQEITKPEATTAKQSETTTKEETTTKKQEETVSKEQTTTDKLNESTTEQVQVTTKDEIKENQSTKENNHSDVTTTANSKNLNKEGLSTGGLGNGEKYQAPGKVKKLKVKKKSLKKIRLSWKKVSGANGYQVSVKVRKKGKFKVVKTIRKNKNKYIRRKYRNKIIYVKVRAYKIVAGNKIYGKYSAVKKYKNK
ncbi:glycosyl hydrolase [uncultured Eubacterium sp.]|uniref:glycosyl hydrolase n=1 Tax=Eubacterium sp. TaxID=142586 RepID=UPI0032662FDC